MTLAFMGCQKAEKPAGPPQFPVVGQLLVDGEPAAGATLKFVPTKPGPQMRSATAQVGVDGRFAASYLTTEDGIPADNYDLLVYWLETPPDGGLPVDRLRGRYCDPSNPVTTITVVAGENHLDPIELESDTR